MWYQGESNNGLGMQYHTRMKALINGWRKAWENPELSFYYVQLAPFRYNNHPETDLPAIWEAQTATLALPHTGMVVTTDIGNIFNIHPANKAEVGHRLAVWALANDYGRKDIVCCGPLYDSHVIEGNLVRIKFKHADGGLKTIDDKPLTWFTIAGEDRKFHAAEPRIDGKTVLVSSPMVSAPAAVRFGFSQVAEPNLANQAGLPASPFRTDGWELGK